MSDDESWADGVISSPGLVMMVCRPITALPTDIACISLGRLVLPALSYWLVTNLTALVIFPLVPRVKYCVRQSGLTVAHNVPISADTTGAPEAPELLLAPLSPSEDGLLACPFGIG